MFFLKKYRSAKVINNLTRSGLIHMEVKDTKPQIIIIIIIKRVKKKDVIIM
jgi:hypothetical protein